MRTLTAALTRPVVAGFVLLVVYGALSLGMDPGGYLGTDTGAKVATLDVMVERDSWRPGLRYWAEELDPSGRLHPIYDAQEIDGDWVHVTTLPMLVLGRPLYEVGGYRLALLLPMLGAVGTAFACRAIARRASTVEPTRAGWLAFWLVGLASPVLVYALDFWEHAPGVACLAGAVALLAAIVDGDRRPQWALAAGVLCGVAATMRTESFVYTLVAVALACLVLLRRHRALGRPLLVGSLSVLGFAAAWFGNAALETALGGNDRGERVAGVASGRDLSELADRAREAATTTLAVRPSDGAELVGLLFVALVVGAVVYAAQQERWARMLMALAVALQAGVLLSGLNFVPGMLVAAPVAIAALVVWPERERVGARYALAVAIGALPLVWAFQLLGGAGPQWAGRYALTSCLLLVALGVAVLTRSRSHVLRHGLIALSVLVTASGAAWLAERSHAVSTYFDELVARPEDVIVVRNGFFIREGGPTYSERLWLTAVTDDDLGSAVDVVEAAGLSSFAVLDNTPSAPEDLHGAVLAGSSRSRVVGTDFYLHSYQLGGS